MRSTVGILCLQAEEDVKYTPHPNSGGKPEPVAQAVLVHIEKGNENVNEKTPI
jgi:hypothetical protein